MRESKRDLLIELGPEALAEALLKLAECDMVVSLTATPDEKPKRFKSKIAGIKRARRFVPWREWAELTGQLERLLAELASAVDDPCEGAELVGACYTTDGGTPGRCDDSSGHVGACSGLMHGNYLSGMPAITTGRWNRWPTNSKMRPFSSGCGVRDGVN